MNLALDELKHDDDVVVESAGITVLYSKDLDNNLENAVVDYSNKWYDKGFHIQGANVGSC